MFFSQYATRSSAGLFEKERFFLEGGFVLYLRHETLDFRRNNDLEEG